jgi:manganese/zinc/iron transport system permease protein
MVVVGLPAAGAVLVTALVVIPPVAARQWTERAAVMLLLAGLIGLAAAVAGVALSTLRPGLATGPLVVLAAGAICLISLLVAPGRGWLARRHQRAAIARRWARGRLLEECLQLAGDDGGGAFARGDVIDRAGGATAAVGRRAWDELVREAAVEPAAAPRAVQPGRERWRLSAAGLARARERQQRVAAWRSALDAGGEAARDAFSLELPWPDEVVDRGRDDGAVAGGSQA